MKGYNNCFPSFSQDSESPQYILSRNDDEISHIFMRMCSDSLDSVSLQETPQQENGLHREALPRNKILLQKPTVIFAAALNIVTKRKQVKSNQM